LTLAEAAPDNAVVCGIAGLLTPPGGTPDPRHLKALADDLAHRGPDDEGIVVDGEVGLVHRRLAIVDLTPAGHQPLANEDGSVHVVYNGQLYGFESLRERLVAQGHAFRSRTDTEILVHLYEERGLDLLEELDGMFAFALWDARRRRLLLARDRLGIKPLYYTQSGGVFAFASELGALLRLPFVPRRIDAEAIFSFLYQSSVPGAASVLEGVKKLPAAHALVIENGDIRTWSYWTPGTAPPPQLSRADLGLELDRRLAAAVRSHLVADVPVGAFLSGGLDSTAVTVHARDAWPGTLHTFSVRFRTPGFDEGPAARATAESLGCQHHELELGPECVQGVPDLLARSDEPFAVASSIALHHLAHFARQTVKVVLTGDGADEILAGYPWRHDPDSGPGARPGAVLRGLGLSLVRSWRGARAGQPGFFAEMIARTGRQLSRPAERYADLVSAFTPEQMRHLAHPDMLTAARRAWIRNPLLRTFEAVPAVDEVNRRLRVDLATTLVDEMLVKVDRATMAAGLEARVPFLDRSLVEWALAQPGRPQLRRGVGKQWLRDALSNRLPGVAARPKHGFDVPLGAWLRGPLREWMSDTLHAERIARRGLLDPGAVGRIVEAHLRGAGDHSRKLLSLLALEVWLERVERALPGAP
jgi:asparagine synthase (glutamine-hydrolysing)